MSAFDAHDDLSGVFRVAPPSAAAEGGRASTLVGALLNSLHLLDGWLLVSTLALGTAGLWLLMGTVQGSPMLVEATQRQMAWFGIGLCGLAAMLVIDYRLIGRWAPLFYVANLAVLGSLLVFGSEVKGATSWIRLGPVSFQPSEPMKILTAMVLAQWFATRPEGVRTLPDLAMPALLAGAPAALILMQNDLGSASLFVCLLAGVVFFGGIRLRVAAVVLVAALALAGSAVPFLKNHQRERLLVFLDGSRDLSGAGYNVRQSIVAVGSGGVVGNGWGEGSQAVHRFLPEAHTDFIYASAVEQTGLLGGLVLIALYGVVMWRMLAIAGGTRDRFGGLLVAGLASVFFGHVVINIGMNVGLLPVTGLPLPFLSYGGSFLLATWITVGLVLNVALRKTLFG